MNTTFGSLSAPYAVTPESNVAAGSMPGKGILILKSLNILLQDFGSQGRYLCAAHKNKTIMKTDSTISNSDKFYLTLLYALGFVLLALQLRNLI